MKKPTQNVEEILLTVGIKTLCTWSQKPISLPEVPKIVTFYPEFIKLFLIVSIMKCLCYLIISKPVSKHSIKK